MAASARKIRYGALASSALVAALDAIQAGKAEAHGLYPRVYPVNDQMELATGFPGNNR
jgi:hypothetical protein